MGRQRGEELGREEARGGRRRQVKQEKNEGGAEELGKVFFHKQGHENEKSTKGGDELMRKKHVDRPK